ncbi:MAG: hypothetical protein RJB36_995 [Bacteroidota bacterium]
MKTRYFWMCMLLYCSVHAQTFEEQFKPVRTKLENWDVVRGAWLAQSMIALSENRNVPDRTFPEDFTPYEMLTMVPLADRRDIESMIQQNRLPNGNFSASQWDQIALLVNHSMCSHIVGRSYGDPHLKSFDHATYSFQTVGEFVLSKSERTQFEVQTRQQAQSDNFSLNAAVAMNVSGDRVCYYASTKPDQFNGNLRLNGMPLQLQGRTYFLPNGGVVRFEGRNYTIAWPTGEMVILDVRSSGSFGFVNTTVHVFDCDRSSFQGLLGNANGIADDDFQGRNMERQRPNYMAFSTFGNSTLEQASTIAEKEYLAFLAKDFAEDWRVTSQTTLFDYAPGTSTEYYTDRRFPMVHLTVAELNPTQRDNARARCQAMGIPADEMGGCIFDQGYLNIAPNQVPTPSRPNPTETVLGTINRPALHTNELIFPEQNLAPAPGSNPLPMEPQKPNMNRDQNPSSERPNPEPNRYNSTPEVPVSRPPVNNPVQVNPVRPSTPNTTPTKPPVQKPVPSNPTKPSVPSVKTGKG